MNASVMDLAAFLDEVGRAHFISALAEDVVENRRLTQTLIEVRYLESGGDPNPWGTEDENDDS